MAIERAWCVELGRVVSINEARRELVGGTDTTSRFTFLCSDERCRAHGTRVTGVNYWRPAQEADKYRAAHFRELDEHLEGCEWREPDPPKQWAVAVPTQGFAPRLARRKLDDLVNVFDPRGARQAVTSIDNEVASEVNQTGAGARHVGEANNPGSPGETRTGSLERLVDLYLEARSTLSKEAFQKLQIKVIGVGRLRLADYFQHLGGVKTTNRVIFGGARLVKRYGLGFKFIFFDQLQGQTVRLYVAHEEMSKYRHRRYLDALLKHVDKVRYFTLYVIGEIQPTSQGGGLELTVDGLHHLVVILGPSRSEDGDSEANTRKAR